MTAPRNSRSAASRLAFVLASAMFAGCGGSPPEVDTAETIRSQPVAKPAPEATPAPPAEPAKDAPKG